ncbi:ubiquitin carboxyl-terminal hydrolase 8 [Pseudohyphozyma bogoriensis]|nr:ubiquitin carboxyl-terminal hydrolase 8 [Pseudohyphozyma bogoriensis]
MSINNPPTPLDQLRPQQSYPEPSEYSLAQWLTSAQSFLSSANQNWADRDKDNGRPAEKAYQGFISVGNILGIALKHPDYRAMMNGASATAKANYQLYSRIKADMLKAKATMDICKDFLQRREAAWVARFGPLPSGSSAPSSSPTNVEAKLAKLAELDAMDAARGRGKGTGGSDGGSDGAYGEGSTKSSSSSASQQTPEQILQARLAGLRSTKQPPAKPPKPSALSSAAAVGSSSPPRSRPSQLPTTDHPPQVLSSRGTDAFEDAAAARSGSAPPGVRLSAGEGQEEGRSESNREVNGHRREGATNGRGVMEEQDDFSAAFPSLDDLEKVLGSGPSTSANGSASRMGLATNGHAKRLSNSQQPSSSPARSTRGPLPAPPTASTSRPPPDASHSSASFSIPFASEVVPGALKQYLSTPIAQAGKGPRVLLLDVRTRAEYEAGRISGETVCIEPFRLREKITSTDIESSLVIAPTEELERFSARNYYDVVVIYDRSSSSLPAGAPPSTAGEAQKALWYLVSAIYDTEFHKCLKRQPILLKGGWEAWVAAKGAQESSGGGDQGSDKSLEDTKRANRKAAVLPTSSGSTAVMRNGFGTETVPLSSPYNSLASSTPASSGYVSPSQSSQLYQSSYSSSSSSLMSPQLTMPPTAAQRPGASPGAPIAPYDYSLSSSTSSRPSYPQPHINGYDSATSSPNNSPLPRPREYGEQSFSYGGGPIAPISYPSLRTTAPPVPPHVTRPPSHSLSNSISGPPPSVGPPPIARPPAVQPAPIRSNSFTASHAVTPYATTTSNTSSRFAHNLVFGDQAIGLTGLKNLGNTCYMNSTIQCLSATIPFARYFKEGSYRRDVNTVNPLGTKGNLADAVSELIRAIWAQKYLFLSPVTFRENICRWAPQFRGTDQHDAQEFLGFLLDGLHEDLNYIQNKPPPVEMSKEREKDLETLPPQIMSQREWDIYRRRDDSFVVQCFQGQFRNQLRCLTCNETFMPLSVPVPTGRGVNKVALMDCIAAFVKEEILEKEDAWNCPRCKVPRKATKRLSLSRLPPILVIHLKRFSFKGPFSDKIETQVQYPLTGLDLTSYIPPPLPPDKRAPPLTSPPRGYVYDLYGVTNHYGNLSSGHYTAYVRNANEWNNIGDSKVTSADPSQVQSAKSAYILYYALRS